MRLSKTVAPEWVGWRTAFLLLCSCAPTVQSGPATSEQGMANVRLEGTAAYEVEIGGRPGRGYLQSVVDEYAERLRNACDKPAVLAEMQGRLDTWCTIEVVDGTLRVTKRPPSAYLGGIKVAEAKIW